MCARRVTCMERDLFFGALRGSHTSFRRLFSMHAPILHAEICAHLPLQHVPVRMVAGAVFREAYRHLPRLRKPERFGKWVTALAGRICDSARVDTRAFDCRSGLPQRLCLVLRHLSAAGLTVSRFVSSSLNALGRGRTEAAVARFGRLDFRLGPGSVIRGTEPMHGINRELASLSLRDRRIFFCHVVAGMAIPQICRNLRVSRNAVFASFLRCFLVLGVVRRPGESTGFADIRRLALLSAVALGERDEDELSLSQLEQGNGKHGEVLRSLREVLAAYRENAKTLLLSGDDFERLTLGLPRMIRSPKTGYRWNEKQKNPERRLFPVWVSAAVHASVLIILCLVMVKSRIAHDTPPALRVSFERAQNDMNAIIAQPKPRELSLEIPNHRETATSETRQSELSPREKIAELLLETLKAKGEVDINEDSTDRELPAQSALSSNDDLAHRLLAQYRDSPLLKRRITASFKGTMPGFASEARSGSGSGRSGTIGNNDPERLERARAAQIAYQQRQKDKRERIKVITQCFAAIKDIAYDKKSAFISLEQARAYVEGEFLKDMAELVAGKCGVDKEQVKVIWQERKTNDSKEVHLGITGTKMLFGTTCDWTNAHPVVKKRVIEFLMAEKHCEIKKVYKEPCWGCGGKGYILQISMWQKEAGRIKVTREVCPVCEGLGYEIVVIYE